MTDRMLDNLRKELPADWLAQQAELKDTTEARKTAEAIKAFREKYADNNKEQN